jgi:Carboxypeptidase regulatory-like domain/TonB-dependent Receptor Plug Domain
VNFRTRTKLLAAGAILLATAICQAQFSANVQGTIKDPSGAVVPNASVILHNVDTGVDLAQPSTPTGNYRFASVAPGNYEVRASAKGFKLSTVQVNVTTEETRGVDVALSIGTSADLTVTSVASQINPEETRLEGTITAEEISRLPLANRDPQELIALTPGITGYQNPSPSQPGSSSSIFSGSFAPPYHANGLGINSNLYLIDDLPVSDAQVQGQALILPNSDMISEVSLQTQTYSVENGTAGSLQVAFTTKSGTNKYHGAVDYGYASQDIGSAYPVEFGAPPYGSKPPFHQNLLLASFGGPIIKDRTFLFGSVAKQDADIVSNSPANPFFTPQFVAWANTAFPNAGPAKGLAFAPNTRDFGGTTTLASTYFPSTCGTLQTVPATVGNDSPLTYNLPCDTPVFTTGATFDQNQPFNGIQWNVRIDQDFRDGKERLYGMYERIDQKFGILSDRPALDADAPGQNKYFSVNYVHIFDPNMVNEAHFGNLRVINGTSLGEPQAASIPYLPITVFTDLNFTFTFPFGATPFAAQTNKQHTYAFRDTLNYTLHRHALRIGYQYYRGDVFQDSSQIYSRPFVPFYFTDSISWISNTVAAGFNLYTIGGNGSFVPQYYGASSTFNGIFAEDTWRVTDNLTLTYGLRYDDFGNPSPYGGGGVFVPLFPGTGSTFQEQAINTYTKVASRAFPGPMDANFAPRAGFAYSPSKDKSLLLRGGIGLYYNALTPFQIAGNLPTQPPNRISLYTTGIVPYGDFKTATAPFGYNYASVVPGTYGVAPNGNIYSNPEHTAVYSANINGFAPHISPDRILSYSFGLEHQLPAHLVLGINYAGSYGFNLLYGGGSVGGSNVDYNLQVGSPTMRPVPAGGAATEWGQVNYGVNGLSSNYNALIVTLRQTYKGFSYQANYNWSRTLTYAPVESDNSNGTTYYLWKAAYDPKDNDYGRASFDVPNSFSFGGQYQVPNFGENRYVSGALANWRIGTLIVAQSGTPFSVLEPGTDYQYDGSPMDGSGNETPALPTYNGVQRSGFSRAKAITGEFASAIASNTLICSNSATCLFSDPPGTGTQPVNQQQGINTFRNLGFFNVNLSVSKGFSIPVPHFDGGMKLYLRGEAINLLNRTNYGPFGNDITNTSTGAVGSVTTANTKRYLQIGGRLEF